MLPDLFGFAGDGAHRLLCRFDVHLRLEPSEYTNAFLLLTFQVTLGMPQIRKDLRQFVDHDIVVAHRGCRLNRSHTEECF